MQLDYEQMRTISSNLKNASSRMEETLNNVKSLIQRNVGADGEAWSGNAAEASRAEFDALIAKFPAFKEAVDTCAKNLDTIVSRYESADSAIIG